MEHTAASGTARLRFAREFTEQDALEAQSRGYLSHVLIELDDGALYPVFFYDPTRLQQDLAEGVRCGRPFLADPGMIIVPEITRCAMQEAVQRVVEEGFLDHFVPVTEEELASGNPHSWPPQTR